MLTRILALIAVLLLAPSTLAHANARALSLESASPGIFAGNVGLLKEIPELTHCCIKEKSTEQAESSNRREEYLRARYMDPTQGRFLGMDSFEGKMQSPASLHKYLYANSDPANGIDPSGNMTLSEISAAIRSNAIIVSRSVTTGTRQFVKRAYTHTLRSSKEAARILRNCLRRRNGCNLTGPVLLLSGSNMPQTAQHVYDAQHSAGSQVQLRPAPFLLHFKNKPKSWREKALAPYKKSGQVCDGSSPLIFCDEYPFFKTREGAPTHLPGHVSLKLVPASEQVIQGGLFRGMQSACGLRERPVSKSRFLVVALTNSDLPSAFLCLR